jgi:uncharacterized RDD family membrane protein YckC
MAKWRDVKQHRVKTTPKEKPKEEKNSCASLSSRMKAFLTDSFLITTPIFYIVIYLIMGSGEGFAEHRLAGWGMIIGVHSLVIILFWLIKQQTPGLKAYDLKIVNSKLKQPNILQYIIRYVATLFAVISFFLLFIPYTNKERKTFQDIISNTIIIDDK